MANSAQKGEMQRMLSKWPCKVIWTRVMYWESPGSTIIYMILLPKFQRRKNDIWCSCNLQDMWHINKCQMQGAISEDVIKEKNDSKKGTRLQMAIWEKFAYASAVTLPALQDSQALSTALHAFPSTSAQHTAPLYKHHNIPLLASLKPHTHC